MKLTRQTMAGLAFAALLIAVVLLHLVGGEDAGSVADRLEGAMGMALAAFLGETALRARAVPVALLAIALGLGLVGCGGAERPTACAITEQACRACEAARQQWCGGEEVETE